MHASKRNKRDTSFYILVFGGIAVIAMFISYALLRLDRSVAVWGTFGDKFGALNCLFTGLACVGVVAALWHDRAQAEGRDNDHRAMMRRMEGQIGATIYAAHVATVNQRINFIQENYDHIRRESGNDKTLMATFDQELAKLRALQKGFIDNPPKGTFDDNEEV